MMRRLGLAATAGEPLGAWVREDFGLDLTSIDEVGHGADERADGLSIVRGVLSPTGLASLALSSVRDLGLVPDERP